MSRPADELLQVNQAQAKAISMEGNYANKSEDLVRSFSLSVLYHDSGQPFTVWRLIIVQRENM